MEYSAEFYEPVRPPSDLDLAWEEAIEDAEAAAAAEKSSLAKEVADALDGGSEDDPADGDDTEERKVDTKPLTVPEGRGEEGEGEEEGEESEEDKAAREDAEAAERASREAQHVPFTIVDPESLRPQPAADAAPEPAAEAEQEIPDDQPELYARTEDQAQVPEASGRLPQVQIIEARFYDPETPGELRADDRTEQVAPVAGETAFADVPRPAEQSETPEPAAEQPRVPEPPQPVEAPPAVPDPASMDVTVDLSQPQAAADVPAPAETPAAADAGVELPAAADAGPEAGDAGDIPGEAAAPDHTITVTDNNRYGDGGVVEGYVVPRGDGGATAYIDYVEPATSSVITMSPAPIAHFMDRAINDGADRMEMVVPDQMTLAKLASVAGGSEGMEFTPVEDGVSADGTYDEVAARLPLEALGSTQDAAESAEGAAEASEEDAVDARPRARGVRVTIDLTRAGLRENVSRIANNWPDVQVTEN
ncbi:MAG TPA: hypothetical protein VLF40_03995 [Candidatus Saccharimonadales bacterium]|nr:hypothetical protein [Candidatus Saccharimonadales bacterium]